MKYEIKKEKNSKIEITITVEKADFAKYRDNAFKNIQKEASISGFRKGMAPENAIIAKYGESSIEQEMANDAINKTYPEVIIGEKLHVISEPNIHIVTLEKDADFVYHAHATVYPTLEIADYKKTASKIISEDKKEIAETTDEEVKNILDQVSEEVKTATPDIENIIKTNVKAEKEMLQKSTLRSKFLDEALKELSETNADAWPEMFTDKDKAQILNIEIAKKEDVKVSEEELSAEVVKLSMHISKEDIASGKIDEEKLTAYAHQILLNEKVFVSLGL